MSVCPICGGEKKKEIGEKGRFRVFRCLDCRSVYTEKMSDDVESYDYSEYYEESNLTVPEFVRQSLRNTISTFEKYRQNGRFLDVGCGAGILLETAREKGWQAEGMEVSEPAVNHLREKGFQIFQGFLSEADYPENHFDVVTMTEVIEHVDNPKEVLREIARILRPNGLLWMTTPHANGLSIKLLGAKWSVVCPPEHLHLFSKKGLNDLLNEAGFTDCRFATHGVNPFEILSHLKNRGQTSENISSDTVNEAAEFDRNTSNYSLNSWFSGGRGKEQIKKTLNSVFSAAKLGDTLKVWATLEK
ncbi:MAG TPA: methyltransferase domain-containing protein [Pyrinomonadaceae bacterium]|nr:methyltransferase domain-containing protein [Pyrinomonadaceae bacterium]